MKKLLTFLIVLALAQSVSADGPVQKGKIEIAGVSYIYLDHCTLWTGQDGIRHIIAVYPDTREFASVSLVTRVGTAAPHFVTEVCDVALPQTGVYLVTMSSKKVLVRIIDWGSPQSTDQKIVRRYIEEALKRPNSERSASPEREAGRRLNKPVD